MGTFIIIIAVSLFICILIFEIQNDYNFYFEWIQDVNLNKVLIVWYNKYSKDGYVTREHKILYDTGRNKK